MNFLIENHTSISIHRYYALSRTAYRKGTGPGVVIKREIPEIYLEVTPLANCVAEMGFTAFPPNVLGTPGKPFSSGYLMQSVVQTCIRREFALLDPDKSSPIGYWLPPYRHAHAERGCKGVGALGIYLTGKVALSLMVDESVMVPLLSRTSLPVGPSNASRITFRMRTSAWSNAALPGRRCLGTVLHASSPLFAGTLRAPASGTGCWLRGDRDTRISR